MYALVENGQITRYPYTYAMLKAAHPGTSWPASMDDVRLAEYGIWPVDVTPQPAFDPVTQVCEEGVPFLDNGQWAQTWNLRSKTPEELAAELAHLRKRIVAAVQDRLDAFAQTRNYDGILSACTYATSTVTKFQAEGQYCVNARDATWATLYAILAAVEANQRPLPTGYADIEAELPVLTWPT